MVILNSLFPVFALILLGTWLKRMGLTDEAFLKKIDRIVYFILFPILLFWKIGGSRGILEESLAYCTVAVIAVTIIFILSTLFIVFGKVGDFQAGTFSQSCYRFNTYVGMAVALTVLGETGVQYFAILIGILIPMINVMAVTILIWYGKKRDAPKKQLLTTLKAIGTNPLFIACVVGMIYARVIGFFPTAIDNTLKLLSMATLPLALISIGGMLTLKSVRQYLGLALTACLFKLVLMPVIGFLLLTALNVTGTSFQVGMLFFVLPTSPAMYVLSSQLNSDTALASATIFLSTLLSFFSISAILLLF